MTVDERLTIGTDSGGIIDEVLLMKPIGAGSGESSSFWPEVENSFAGFSDAKEEVWSGLNAGTGLENTEPDETGNDDAGKTTPGIIGWGRGSSRFLSAGIDCCRNDAWFTTRGAGSRAGSFSLSERRRETKLCPLTPPPAGRSLTETVFKVRGASFGGDAAVS
jgi:hypothetical protein